MRVVSWPGADPLPLSLFGVILAPSGGGKTSAMRGSRTVVPDPGDDDALFDQPIGSGEGLAEAYMGFVDDAVNPKRAPQRQQVRHRVHFHVDEGETLLRLIKRDGATLGGLLRQAFSAEVLGQRNATAERTRVVKDYTLGLTINATASVVTGLLANADLGLPQRFLWASAVDPGAVRHPAPAPAPSVYFGGGLVTTCKAVEDELTERVYLGNCGELVEDPLDAHLPIARVRVAAILAIRAGGNVITEDDWHLAGTIVENSCAVRAAAIKAAEEIAADELAVEAEKRGKMAQTVRAHANGTEAAVERVAARIGRRVHKTGRATRRSLAVSCTASGERHLLTSAIDAAVAHRWIAPEGDVFAPGPSVPA